MKYHMCVFAIVAIIALISTNINGGTHGKKRGIQYITVIMAAFLGLRTWWMADVIKYHTQYMACGAPNWRDEVFSKVDNIAMRLFFRLEYLLTGGNYQIALIIIAVFTMGCLGYVIYKYSTSPYWSYVMYIAMGFYFFTFSGLKQSIAMAFLLLAFKGIVENRPTWFWVMTIIAGLFHTPAFVFIPAYFVARKKIDKSYWLYLLAIFAMFFVFKNQIVGFLSEMYYEENLALGVEGGLGGRFLMIFAMLIGGIILRPPSGKDHIYSKVFNLVVFGALLQSFSMYGNEFSRLADYYLQFLVLFVPFVFEYRDETRRDVLSVNAKDALIQFNWRSYQLVYMGITIFSVWYFCNYISTDISGILDYKFFWEVAETPWGS